MNFYLLYCNDKAILNHEIEKIKSKLSIPEEEIIYYDINDINNIVIEAQTISMFSDKKILIVDGTSYLSDKKDIDNIKLLEDYFDNYNPNTYMIFVSYSDSIDSKKRLVKLISANGICKKLEASDSYLENYAFNYMKDSGYKFDKILCTYLVSRCGHNLDNLKNELDKLMLYKINNKEITRDDINKLTSENIEESIFDLVNAIIKKDTAKAIKLYNNFVLEGMDVTQIINMLASQVRLLFQVKRLYNQGKSNDEISKILEFKSVYRVKYLLSDSYYYTEKDLLNILSDLALLDKDIKLGLRDGNVGIELLITKKDM